MTVNMKHQPTTSPLSTVKATAPADALQKDSTGNPEDRACVFAINLGARVMKEMAEPDEKTLRLLNDYQKASPGLRESLSEAGFMDAHGELDEPYVRENWPLLWEIFPGEKYKDIPEEVGGTKTAENLFHATEALLQTIVASVAESPAGTDELTGMTPAITAAGEESEQAVDVQTLRLLLDEETRESVVATVNEFIREGGRNREHLDDLGPELKAAVESLESTLGKLESPEDRSVLAAAVKVMKGSMEAMLVSPETAKGLSAGEKQARLNACEALKDLSVALEGAVNTLKSVRTATTGSDVLGLPEKLSNARHKIKDALEVVKNRRNESIESTYPDKSGRVRAALQRVAVPGSKKDPVTDVLNSLKAHEQNLKKGVYRELIYIREATQTLSRAVDTLPKGKVRDAVSQLQTFCEFLAPHLKGLASGKPPVIAGAKELKEAANVAIALYRTLMDPGITADEPGTQREVFNEAVDKLLHAHKSIKSQALKHPLRDTGLAFSLVRPSTRGEASVGTWTDTLTQLKEMAVTLRGTGAKMAHVMSGLTEKMGSPGAERKKLTNLLEVKSEPLLTSLHWFELKGRALAGSAKAADKVANMQVHKKGTDPLSNISDTRAQRVKAVSSARAELKEAFTFVEHRWQETEKELQGLMAITRDEFTRAKAQLQAMEKDTPRKLPALPEEIKQQRKEVDTLRKFLSDIQLCQVGFQEAVKEARKAAGSAEALAFSQDHLTKTDVGLPASQVLLQVEGAMRTAAATLRGVTHREPEVYGPQQKVAMYLALVLAERVNEQKASSPEEKHARVEALADTLAGDIDSPGFDRKAFAALIKAYYRQKCDGTLKLPREYRAVLAEPGLKWASLMTDKGAARLGSSSVSLALRRLISQSVNVCMPGGIVGSAWGRIRGAVSAGLIYQAGEKRVDSLRKSVMPGHALPSGTLSGARKDTWKSLAASTAEAALPQVLRAAKHALSTLNDIRENGFAHTMEQAGNHFVADNLISSGLTLAAAGGRDGAEAVAEFLDGAVAGASVRNQVFPYRGKGDHVEQAVGEMADIVRRGRAGPEGMRKDEVAVIDRALDDALTDLAQEKAKLSGVLTKTERDFIKERGLTPKELMAACDAQSERLRPYLNGGENANQLVILGKSRPGQPEFAACVRDGDSRIFIRQGAGDLKRVLRHEVTHLIGKDERETRNIMATLMSLRTGDHSIARSANIGDGDSEALLHNDNGLHFHTFDGGSQHYDLQDLKALEKMFNNGTIRTETPTKNETKSIPDHAGHISTDLDRRTATNYPPSLDGSTLTIPGYGSVNIYSKDELSRSWGKVEKAISQTVEFINARSDDNDSAEIETRNKLIKIARLVAELRNMLSTPLSEDDKTKAVQHLTSAGGSGISPGDATLREDQNFLKIFGANGGRSYESILKHMIYLERAEKLVSDYHDLPYASYSGIPVPFDFKFGDSTSNIEQSWLKSVYQKHGINPERIKTDYIAVWPLATTPGGDGGVNLINVSPVELAANTIHHKLDRLNGNELNEYTVHYPNDYPQGLKDDLEKGMWDDFKTKFREKFEDAGKINSCRENMKARAQISYALNAKTKPTMTQINTDLSHAVPLKFAGHTVAGMFIIPDKTNSDRGKLYSIDPTFKAVKIKFGTDVSKLLQKNPALKEKVQSGLIGDPESEQRKYDMLFKFLKEINPGARYLPNTITIPRVFAAGSAQEPLENWLFDDVKKVTYQHMDNATVSNNENYGEYVLAGTKFLLTAFTSEMTPEVALTMGGVQQIVIPEIQSEWVEDPVLAEKHTEEALWGLVTTAVLVGGSKLLSNVRGEDLENKIRGTVDAIKANPAEVEAQVTQFTQYLEDAGRSRSILPTFSQDNGISILTYSSDLPTRQLYSEAAQDLMKMDVKYKGKIIHTHMADHVTNDTIVANQVQSIIQSDPTGTSQIHVFTGTHGNPNGLRSYQGRYGDWGARGNDGALGFTEQDGEWRRQFAEPYRSRIILHDMSTLARPGDVNDVLTNVVKGGDHVVGAFCFSANDKVLAGELGIPTVASHAPEIPPSGVRMPNYLVGTTRKPMDWWMKPLLPKGAVLPNGTKFDGKYTATGKETLKEILDEFCLQNNKKNKKFELEQANRALPEKYKIPNNYNPAAQGLPLPAGTVINLPT